MSGAAYGTVVRHASPEAAAGGTLALVRSGDMITLDVAKRVLHLEVDEATPAARRSQWVPPPLPKRGWVRLYIEHVQQADQGQTSIFLSAIAALTSPAIRIEEQAFNHQEIPSEREFLGAASCPWW